MARALRGQTPSSYNQDRVGAYRGDSALCRNGVISQENRSSYSIQLQSQRVAEFPRLKIGSEYLLVLKSSSLHSPIAVYPIYRIDSQLWSAAYPVRLEQVLCRCDAAPATGICD